MSVTGNELEGGKQAEVVPGDAVTCLYACDVIWKIEAWSDERADIVMMAESGSN